MIAPVFAFAQNYWQKVVTVMLSLMIGAPLIMQMFARSTVGVSG